MDEGSTDGRVHSDAHVARAGVSGGCGRDNSGGGAGSVAIPHLCITCSRCMQCGASCKLDNYIMEVAKQ